MRNCNIYGLKTFSWLFISASVLIVSACSEDDEQDNSIISENVIEWDIDLDNGQQGTRALYTTESLRKACTPDAGIVPNSDADKSERIFICADVYNKKNNVKQEFYIYDMLGYYEKADGKRKGEHWNYAKPDMKWEHGKNMVCRAFFPANELVAKKMIDGTTTPSSLIIDYSTMQEQLDLLVAYNKIDTDTRTDKDNVQVSKGIPMLLHHALAALEFRFIVNDNNAVGSNKLTSCYLKTKSGSKETVKFATVGHLIYGTSNEGEEGLMKWGKSYMSENEELYKWTAAGDGISFDTDSYAVAYSDTSDNIYSKNNGSLLVIPQQVPENLYLCFTTENGGPDNIIETPVNMGGTSVDGKFMWEHDTRYIYTVRISNAEVSIEATVAPWNNINSNINIDF